MLKYQWYLPLDGRIVNYILPFYFRYIFIMCKYYFDPEVFSLVYSQILSFVKYTFQRMTQNPKQCEEKILPNVTT